MGVVFLFYSAISFTGYFSLFNATSDVVLERPPLPNFNPDYCALGAAISISLVLFAAYPVNWNPGRNMYFVLMYNDANFSAKG